MRGTRSTSVRQMGPGTAVVIVLLVLAVFAVGCGSDADGASTADGADATDSTDDTDAPDGEDSADGSETDDGTGETADGDTSEEDVTEEAVTDEESDSSTELFPDVLDATATADSDGTWTFSATLSSPYDSPERYADAWRVVGPDGAVYGIRELAHDHASEQPFTRSQSGIEIPDEVATVIVEGRDQVSGWGGATTEVTLER